MATKQQRFFEMLTKRLLDGEFVNGSFLPCEMDLAKEYALSRVTIRAVLQKMVKQKILKTIPYKGYQVIKIPSQPLPDALNIGALWCSNALVGYAYNLYSSAEQEAKENCYELFVRSSGDDSKEQAALLSELLEIKTDGLLIVPTFDPAAKYMTLGNHTLLTLLRKAGKPLVMLDRDFPENDLPCVLNDEYGGGQLVAEHFASLGHKRVALFAPEISYYIAKQRIGGFIDGCRKRGISCFHFSFPADEYCKDPAVFYKENIHSFMEFARKNKVTAFLINETDIYDKILKDFDGIESDMVLYDTDMNVPTKSNVWRVERPINKIAEQATAMLLDEIKSRASNPVRQIRLKPVIKALPKK